MQLKEYSRKRTFQKSSEPRARNTLGKGNAFVVHRHHATRLHYDLRLENDGVLKSWAVPKGLPPRPGVMRLAVSVEDHPLAYVDFEGEIPKGEYGGGKMWQFARGCYEIIKQKKDGFYFRLQSPQLNAEYRIHRTQDDQWLLERVDQPQRDWLHSAVEPMLAKQADAPPKSPDYLFEVKWDGIRAIIILDDGHVNIRGRNGLDLTKQFPELLAPDAFRASTAVFDGEIVCLQSDGKPVFSQVIHRMHQRSEAAATVLQSRCPAVCYLFDCLYLDGRPIIDEPLIRRREWLEDCVKSGTSYRVSEAMDDGAGLYDAIKAHGLEGVMAKLRTSTYSPGKRSDAWLKIKARQTVECVIIGFTRGKGDRGQVFGALHLAELSGKDLKYVGKVGSGFDEASLKDISAALDALPRIKRPIRKRPVDENQTVWIQPQLICAVRYASRTTDGILREAVFLRLRPDLTFQRVGAHFGSA